MIDLNLHKCDHVQDACATISRVDCRPGAPQTTASIRDDTAVRFAMQRLLSCDRELCDFTFVVGEQRERLPAVRAVVAVRSAPLRAMLFDDKFQLCERELELPQWNPRAFMHLLEFLHSGAADVDAGTVLELMQLADFFQIDELKGHCKAFLAENLSAETVATLLAEAVRFNDEQLRSKCKEFFLANARVALQSPAFCQLPQEILVELLGDNALNADEWGVYQAVKLWVGAQQRQKRLTHGSASARSFSSDAGCTEDEAVVAAAAADTGSVGTLPLAASAATLAAGPLRCVRLGQLTVEQLRAVRADGLVADAPLLDAALNKLDGREAPEGRRRTVCFSFRFDGAAKGDGVSLTEDRQMATFGKDNCVLGDALLPDFGQAYWEVLVSSGTNAYVGIARRERIDVQRNMGSGGGIAFRGIGGNEKWKECSHFEYGRRLQRGDRVGVLVDLPARSVSFYMNGEPLGVAFDNLDPAKRYWPCVSNNAGEMRLVPSPRLPP